MSKRTHIPPIDLAIDTPADPGTAWLALTEPERIALWFTDASPLGDEGAAYRLDFGDGSVVAGVIVQLEPGHRFAHTWTWESAADQTTRVAWSVEGLPDGGSRIRLVHDGWDEAGAGIAERDDHESYWSGYLDDLRDLLEQR